MDAGRLKLSDITDHKAVVFARNWVKIRLKRDLLSVLESTFACGIEKSDKMSAAHIADLVDSVIAKLV